MIKFIIHVLFFSRKTRTVSSISEDSVLPFKQRALVRRTFLKRKRISASKNSSLLDPDEILADSVSVLRTGDVLDRKIERPIGNIPSLMFMILIAGGMIYLIARAASLQITSGRELFAKSQENRFVVRSLYPPRGIIMDTRGKPMVENVPSFGLIFDKDEFLKGQRAPQYSSARCSLHALAFASSSACRPETKQNPREALDFVLGDLARILGKDGHFFDGLGFPSDRDPYGLPSRIVLAHDIPVEKVAEVSARLDALPGVLIVESYRRIYTYPHALAHLLGFTAKMTEHDLQSQPELRYEETIGKTGIEQHYDKVLRGKSGKKIIEVNSKGIETRFRMTEELQEGAPLKLAVDSELQQIAYDIVQRFTGGTKGASVVMLDPRSGAVRALMSFPGFDTNRFGATLTQKEFDELTQNPLKPFFNRAIGGEFPSGSTFKPLVAAAALEEKLIDPKKKIYDEGYIEIPNPYRPGESAVFRDWKKHGWVDMYDAIAQSANVYFYTVGGGFEDQKGLGIERIKKYAESFGLNRVLGIDIPGERPGLIPDAEAKKIISPQDPVWRLGDTYNVSIGQGGVKTTPLQITSMIAAIANGGKLYAPHILDSVFDNEGNMVERVLPRVIREGMVDRQHLEIVRQGMRATVMRGTARLLNGMPLEVAAKTGTAQAGSGKPHAWVTGFFPFDDPQIAFTVMVEHAGEGSTVAVPITKEILHWYITHRLQPELEDQNQESLLRHPLITPRIYTLATPSPAASGEIPSLSPVPSHDPFPLPSAMPSPPISSPSPVPIPTPITSTSSSP